MLLTFGSSLLFSFSPLRQEDEDAIAPPSSSKPPASNGGGGVVPIGFQNAILLLVKHQRIGKDAAAALLTAMAGGNVVLKTIYNKFADNNDARSFLGMLESLVRPAEEKEVETEEEEDDEEGEDEDDDEDDNDEEEEENESENDLFYLSLLY